MYGCDNCGIKKAGLVDMLTGRLCLDCYERFQNARNSALEQDMAKISELTAMMSYYDEVMDYQLGFRPIPPKFNPPKRSQTMNQNINFSNNNVGVLNSGPNSSGSNHGDVYNGSFLSEHIQNLLTQLITKVQECSEIAQEKETLVESLGFIHGEIQKTEKNKTMLKSAVEKITDLAKLNTGIQQLWNSCLPLIQSLAGLVS